MATATTPARTDGSVDPLVNEVAGAVMQAKNTIPYRDAIRVATAAIAAVRAAEGRQGSSSAQPGRTS